jgi:hypothetical protein
MENPMRLQPRVSASVSAVAIMTVGFAGIMILCLTGCSSSGNPTTQTDTAETPANPSATPAAKAAKVVTPAKVATPAKVTKAAVPAPPAWQVSAQGGAKASLDISTSGVMKVNIGQLGDGKGWQVLLAGPGGAVKAKERYTVSFRARAAEPRTMVVKAQQAKDPWESLGLFKPVSLTEQWQSFRLDFESTLDEPKARLGFNLGESAAAVEIADLDLAPQAWFFGVSKDAEATLETPAGLPAAARVTIAKAADAERPWAVRINGPSFPVSEGEELYASFRARADAPRQIIATVNMANPPGSSLGLRKLVELSTEWKSFGFAFKPTASAPAAHLMFHLGESDAAVEVQSASVRKAAWNLTARKDHEAVLTFLDRVPDGMRVEFGRLPELKSSQVRLTSQPMDVKADAKYQVSFRIRTDKPREVVFTLREAQEPWTNLGLYGVIPAKEKWQSITREFTAKADASNAVWAFDLGGSDIPVELADVSFGPAKPKPTASN